MSSTSFPLSSRAWPHPSLRSRLRSATVIATTSPAVVNMPGQAKLDRVAARTWPMMEQTEVHSLTVALKDSKGKVTIFCVDDTRVRQPRAQP